jgi:aerobic C4-dicarboxylate transport protein
MHKTLYFQVIIAIGLGIGLGWASPETAVLMKPLADAFIKLIKMMISPIIFCTVVTGIAGMEAMKDAGRVGIKALLYFEVMTTLALIIGLIVVHLWQPGTGMHIDPATLDSHAIESYASKAAEQKGAVDFLLQIIPSTITEAFVRGDMLQILLVAILFASGLVALSAASR